MITLNGSDIKNGQKEFMGMEQLKSSDFLKEGTMVYGCGVENKTDRGYRKAVDFDKSGIQLIGVFSNVPTSHIKMQKEASK